MNEMYRKYVTNVKEKGPAKEGKLQMAFDQSLDWIEPDQYCSSGLLNFFELKMMKENPK